MQPDLHEWLNTKDDEEQRSIDRGYTIARYIRLWGGLAILLLVALGFVLGWLH